MMKKRGRLISLEGSHATNISQQKMVSLIKGEEVSEQDRTYGMMRASMSVTPYPKYAKPIDLDFLSAKLDDEKKQTRVSLGSGTMKPGSSYHENEDYQTERHRTFAERRKLFDEGEFTICKGRKLSDDFHPLHSAENDHFDHFDHIEDIDMDFIERKSINTRLFNAMEAYCRENNFKMQRGTNDH